MSSLGAALVAGPHAGVCRATKAAPSELMLAVKPFPGWHCFLAWPSYLSQGAGLMLTAAFSHKQHSCFPFKPAVKNSLNSTGA